MRDEEDDPSLYVLLKNEELFQEVIENNSLSKDDLRYLLNRIDRYYELSKLCENTSLLKYIVNNDVFKEIVDKCKSIKDEEYDPSLYLLLENKEFFKELIENNKLNIEDLRYLLNRTDSHYELRNLSKNTSLIKKILNEFVLDKENVDKLEKIDGSPIFEHIEYYNENNKEILELNELNKKVYLLNSFDLNEDQRLELSEVLNNEQAQNTLIQIVENNLEDQYDFESLKKMLNKDDKKLKTKFNF